MRRAEALAESLFRRPGIDVEAALRRCPYDGAEVRRSPRSDHVYREDHGPIWECPECGARVGENRRTGLPLGTVARLPDRRARSAAHVAFDPLWRDGPLSRSAAYARLTDFLGADPAAVHFSMMHGEDLREAVRWALRERGLG